MIKIHPAALLLPVALVLSACGGSTSEGSTEGAVIVEQGAIALADSAVEEETTPTVPTEPAGGAAEGDDSDAEADDNAVAEDDKPTGTTLPKEEQSVDDDFFDAVGVFMSCMNVEANGFVGLPDPAETADSLAPQNAPAYLEALGECATRSDIINKIAAAEDSSRFTAEEIEERNRDFLEFRDCMIGRGWGIPDPTPDENGLLFHDYVAATQWDAPPGESLLDSDDFGECSENLNSLAGVGDDNEEES